MGSALNAIGGWAAIIAIWGFASAHFHANSVQIALLGLALVGPRGSGRPTGRGTSGPVRAAGGPGGIGRHGAATAVAMASADSFGVLAALAFGSGLVRPLGPRPGRACRRAWLATQTFSRPIPCWPWPTSRPSGTARGGGGNSGPRRAGRVLRRRHHLRRRRPIRTADTATAPGHAGRQNIIVGRLEGRAAVGLFHAGRAAHVGPGGGGPRVRGAPSSSSSPCMFTTSCTAHRRYSGCSRRRGGLGCW